MRFLRAKVGLELLNGEPSTVLVSGFGLCCLGLPLHDYLALVEKGETIARERARAAAAEIRCHAFFEGKGGAVYSRRANLELL
jgi:hypothetical protein